MYNISILTIGRKSFQDGQEVWGTSRLVAHARHVLPVHLSLCGLLLGLRMLSGTVLTASGFPWRLTPDRRVSTGISGGVGGGTMAASWAEERPWDNEHIRLGYVCTHCELKVRFSASRCRQRHADETKRHLFSRGGPTVEEGPRLRPTARSNSDSHNHAPAIGVAWWWKKARDCGKGWRAGGEDGTYWR